MADTTPHPCSTLHVSTMTWGSGTPLHRVHLAQYAGAQFNPGVQGNARFSPIQNAQGQPIPTLYGGSSFECAAMETVFHDVPFAPGFKSYDAAKLQTQMHSRLELGSDLLLADLRAKPLRKLGVERRQLIDTEKDRYPLTRLWAAAIHAQCPEVQGLCWVSRQDDSALAVMLFGDRVAAGTLVQTAPSASLLHDSQTYDAVLTLAEQIGVCIVPGRMPVPSGPQPVR